jgi:acetolactate synthase-1/2/3 large subunit
MTFGPLGLGLEGRLKNASALLPLREQILARLADRATEDRFPFTPQRIVHDVRQVMPEDGIVCLDIGMYKIWFARNYRNTDSKHPFVGQCPGNNGGRTTFGNYGGYALSPRPVLAVCGDGGFMMNSQELETAMRLGLNLVVLILQDNAYGMIRWKQAVDSFADWGLTFGNPDFRQVCGSLRRERIAS